MAKNLNSTVAKITAGRTASTTARGVEVKPASTTAPKLPYPGYQVYDVCQVSDDQGKTWLDYATIKDASDAWYAVALCTDSNFNTLSGSKRVFRIIQGTRNVTTGAPYGTILVPVGGLKTGDPLHDLKSGDGDTRKPRTPRKPRAKVAKALPAVQVPEVIGYVLPASAIIAAAEKASSVPASDLPQTVEELADPAKAAALAVAMAPANLAALTAETTTTTPEVETVTTATATKPRKGTRKGSKPATKPSTKPAAEKPASKPATATSTPAKKAEGGLTNKAIKVLTLLSKAPNGLTRKAMIEKTGIQKGWAKLLGAPTKGNPGGLEGKGLVKSSRTEGDAKITYVITAAGRKAISK